MKAPCRILKSRLVDLFELPGGGHISVAQLANGKCLLISNEFGEAHAIEVPQSVYDSLAPLSDIEGKVLSVQLITDDMLVAATEHLP